jgi:2-oxoglutarate ferredoxin oxidoreductase subunit delta
MQKVTIDAEGCKGCSLCVRNCPRGLVVLDMSVLNSKGFHPAVALRQDECRSCAACARTCPDVVITVVREEKEAV